MTLNIEAGNEYVRLDGNICLVKSETISLGRKHFIVSYNNDDYIVDEFGKYTNDGPFESPKDIIEFYSKHEVPHQKCLLIYNQVYILDDMSEDAIIKFISNFDSVEEISKNEIYLYSGATAYILNINYENN